MLVFLPFSVYKNTYYLKHISQKTRLKQRANGLAVSCKTNGIERSQTDAK